MCCVDSNGVTLLDTKNGLPNGTFVSYEAINWIRYNCIHARSYIEAVAILQVRLDAYMFIYVLVAL